MKTAEELRLSLSEIINHLETFDQDLEIERYRKTHPYGGGPGILTKEALVSRIDSTLKSIAMWDRVSKVLGTQHSPSDRHKFSRDVTSYIQIEKDIMTLKQMERSAGIDILINKIQFEYGLTQFNLSDVINDMHTLMLSLVEVYDECHNSIINLNNKIDDLELLASNREAECQKLLVTVSNFRERLNEEIRINGSLKADGEFAASLPSWLRYLLSKLLSL